MALRIARFSSLFLTALTLGLAFAHALEIPGKLRLDGAQWLTVQNNLYVGFGTAGAVAEVLAMLTTWLALVLLVQARGWRPASRRTLAAAILITLAHAVWWLFIRSVNAQIAAWTPETLAADWTAWRNQWEAAHALRALLFGAGFAALLAAALGEIPTDRGSER